MKKFERSFYIAIIGVQFALIIFSFVTSQKAKQTTAAKTAPQRFSSFYGQEKTGEKNLVHFTPYSGKRYIFLLLASDCHYCEDYIQNLGILETREETENDIEVIVLLTEPDERISQQAPSLRTLQISPDDMFQFGMQTPAILIVNGKGDLLLKRLGYKTGLFEQTLENARQMLKKKSEVVL